MPIIDYSFAWEEDSQRWIDGLSGRMDHAFTTGLSLAFKDGMAWALKSSRSNIPRFEFWAQRSLAIYGFKSTADMVTMTLGFGNEDVFVDDSDVVDAPRPFNYAWAKESSEPAGPHQVWLYNPRTGKSTKNRAKLVRWLKANGGGGPDWGKLPDEPTKDTWNRKGSKADRENFPPPFVYVTPEKTASAYITWLHTGTKDALSPLGRKILENKQLLNAIKIAWET
jgi:hypothetical protein